MTSPRASLLKCGSWSRLVEPERILPDHVVGAKSALRPEALKPARLGRIGLDEWLRRSQTKA
jgi:hypothetical protein